MDRLIDMNKQLYVDIKIMKYISLGAIDIISLKRVREMIDIQISTDA